MCIRDSLEGELGGLANDVLELLRVALPRRLDNDPIDALAAVSYTHLRAHETVLDLVCRLLLEKKKYVTI